MKYFFLQNIKITWEDEWKLNMEYFVYNENFSTILSHTAGQAILGTNDLQCVLSSSISSSALLSYTASTLIQVARYTLSTKWCLCCQSLWSDSLLHYAMAGEVRVWVSRKPIHQPWEFYTGGVGVNDRKCWYLKINFMTRHNIIIHKHFNDWYLEYKDGLTDGKISRKKGLTNWPKTAFQPCLVLNHATQRDDAKTWTLYLDLPVRKRKRSVEKWT